MNHDYLRIDNVGKHCPLTGQWTPWGNASHPHTLSWARASLKGDCISDCHDADCGAAWPNLLRSCLGIDLRPQMMSVSEHYMSCQNK